MTLSYASDLLIAAAVGASAVTAGLCVVLIVVGMRLPGGTRR